MLGTLNDLGLLPASWRPTLKRYVISCRPRELRETELSSSIIETVRNHSAWVCQDQPGSSCSHANLGLGTARKEQGNRELPSKH